MSVASPTQDSGGVVADEITKLLQQPGKSITVSGCPTLVRSLLRDGPLDELQRIRPEPSLGLPEQLV